MAKDEPLEWLVRGVVVAGQPLVVGGPQKSLKTSILLDLGISLGSGTPFLGHFEVPRRVRVGLVSGESGDAILRMNAREVCQARGLQAGVDPVDLEIGCSLPNLASPDHLRAIRRLIRKRGLEVIMFDPLYLMLRPEVAGVSPNDMFAMGPLYSGIAETCLDAGALPVLAHHFIKFRANPHDPPDLNELAYSGLHLFVRQWLLVARRERFNPELGVHKLFFSYGGSAGHMGEKYLDIDAGRVEEDLASGRAWDVTILPAAESIEAAREDRQKAQVDKIVERGRINAQAIEIKVREDGTKILQFLIGKPGEPQTKAAISAHTRIYKERLDAALAELARLGCIEEAPTTAATGTGRRPVNGWRPTGRTEPFLEQADRNRGV